MSNRITPKSRPRFAVVRRESKRDARCWLVIDRQARKSIFRSFNRSTAAQVAAEHNEIHTPAPRSEWPAWTTDGQWVLTTPEIAPAEAEALEEPSPDDRQWWAAQDDDADDRGTLLASLDSGLSAFLDRVGADSWEEADLAEFRR
jgi:hypothetical protein